MGGNKVFPKQGGNVRIFGKYGRNLEKKSSDIFADENQKFFLGKGKLEKVHTV